MQVKKQLLELEVEQQTGSKLGKECIKAVYSHPAYLTFLEELKNKHTETNNTITETKNTVEGINSRISEAKE